MTAATTEIAAPSPPTLVNWIEIATLGVIWGASFMAVHVALDGFGPFWVAAGRIGIAALTLTAFSALRGVPLPSPRADRRVWGHAIGMGVFSNVLPFSLLAWAQLHVTSGFAGITMALVPLFTLVLAHRLLPGEGLTLPRIAGFSLGLAGVVVLIGTDALSANGGTLEPVARVTCILAALSYAIGAVITRRCPPTDPVGFSTAALLAASTLLIPAALALEGIPQANAAALVALAYLGLLPTAVATLILVHVVRSAGPTFLTQTNYQVPIWSVLFGTLLLSEPLPPQFLAALALILAGLAVSRYRRR